MSDDQSGAATEQQTPTPSSPTPTSTPAGASSDEQCGQHCPQCRSKYSHEGHFGQTEEYVSPCDLPLNHGGAHRCHQEMHMWNT